MINTIFCVISLLTTFVWGQTPPAQVPTSQPPAAEQGTPNSNNPSVEGGTEAIFDMSPQIDYVYDPTGKKDPFKPYKAPRIRGDNRPVAPLDPLSIVEVTSLKLVALLWNTSKPRAVVKDAMGKSYILFKNMRIGRNEGVVVDIREGEIVIVEKFDDGFGNTVREARVLEMNAPENSDRPAGG